MSKYERKIAEDLDCGIVVAMKIFGAKWKPCILDAIDKGFTRPSEIHRQIQGATERVIDMQLKELEQHGIVQKHTKGGFPLHTEYQLTQRGKSIKPIIASMNDWGIANRDLFADTE